MELLDAGTVLPSQMACMPPADAQTLDLGLRTAENERDTYKTVVAVTIPVAVVAVVAAIAAGICATTGCHR